MRERNEEGHGRAGKRASIFFNYVYICVTSTNTYFILHKVIRFTWTTFYFIMHRNKSKIMSGVATNCSNQHSKFRQNAVQSYGSII